MTSALRLAAILDGPKTGTSTYMSFIVTSSAFSPRNGFPCFVCISQYTDYSYEQYQSVPLCNAAAVCSL